MFDDLYETNWDQFYTDGNRIVKEVLIDLCSEEEDVSQDAIRDLVNTLDPHSHPRLAVKLLPYLFRIIRFRSQNANITVATLLGVIQDIRNGAMIKIKYGKQIVTSRRVIAMIDAQRELYSAFLSSNGEEVADSAKDLLHYIDTGEWV